jgi:hypothetical protein
MQIERWNLQPEPEDSTARDVQLAKLAARQHGVVTFADLIACGFTPDAISVRAGNGRLHPLHKGVYAVGHANVTQDGCYLAAVKACGDGAALCLRSAGVLLNTITWENRYPDVLVLGESAPQHPRIRGHRTNYLPPEHVTTVRGIPVTTAERTLLDLAGVLPEERPRRAVRQSWFLKLTTVRSLVEARRPPDRPGLPLARAAPRDRGRRPAPRRPARTRGRPRAPAHPRSTRLPGAQGHLGAGDRSPRRHPAPRRGRRRTASGGTFRLSLKIPPLECGRCRSRA